MFNVSKDQSRFVYVEFNRTPSMTEGYAGPTTLMMKLIDINKEEIRDISLQEMIELFKYVPEEQKAEYQSTIQEIERFLS